MIPHDVTLEDGTVVNFRDLRAVLTPEVIAGILEAYLNAYCNEQKRGKDLGEALLHVHPTLQGGAVRWLLGIFEGLATCQYTDARNEVAIWDAKAITEQVKSGTIKWPPFI